MILAKKLKKGRFLTIKSTPTQKCGAFMNFETHRHDQNLILHLLSPKTQSRTALRAAPYLSTWTGTTKSGDDVFNIFHGIQLHGTEILAIFLKF